MVSGVHNVCKKGFSIAIISTNVETNNPEKELEPAFALLGPVLEKFFTVRLPTPTSLGLRHVRPH